jgi:UPF0755 protein
MRSRRIITLQAALLSLALLLCAGVCLVVGGSLFLFNRVEAIYGAPKPGLDLVDRVYLSTQLFLGSDALTTPRGILSEPLAFNIAFGETPQSIAANLQDAGAIADADAFLAFLEYAGLDTSIQAGEYEIDPVLNSLEIAKTLQDATPKDVDFSVLPGWRVEEIAATLTTSGLEFTPDEFLAAIRTAPEGFLFLQENPPGSSLEGFLYPGMYRIPRESNVRQFLAILLGGFESQLTQDLLQGFERQGLDLYDAVTLASIVQRETVVVDEMPTIASVFLNRLAIGMALEADSTVQYALGYNESQGTWWTNPLSSRDLQTDSLSNTYRYPWLPPSPIANPGVDALRAVAFPAQTPYYYFRATCDDSGRHAFAVTFEEHLQNACPP